jgi:hypothetical protein
VGMAKKSINKGKKQGKADEKLSSDEEFKEQYPKQAEKMRKPEEPPPDVRSTDPRRKQR